MKAHLIHKQAQTINLCVNILYEVILKDNRQSKQFFLAVLWSRYIFSPAPGYRLCLPLKMVYRLQHPIKKGLLAPANSKQSRLLAPGSRFQFFLPVPAPVLVLAQAPFTQVYRLRLPIICFTGSAPDFREPYLRGWFLLRLPLNFYRLRFPLKASSSGSPTLLSGKQCHSLLIMLFIHILIIINTL